LFWLDAMNVTYKFISVAVSKILLTVGIKNVFNILIMINLLELFGPYGKV